MCWFFQQGYPGMFLLKQDRTGSYMKLYSKQGLWALFLISAFPLHVWTIILAFRDFSWVTERTNSWDAVGVVSYGLIFTFLESVLVFLVAVLLGLFVSGKWAENRRITTIGILVIITSLWAMASYLFFMLNISIPRETILFFKSLAHPLRVLYAISLALVGPTIAIPVFLVLRSDKFLKGMQSVFERLSLLTVFYLFFDFVGLVIVIIRNI
jgi:hypothetical protein